MTTAELIKQLRAAAWEADSRGRPTIAHNLRLAIVDLLEQAKLEEDAAMLAHLRAHSTGGHTAETEEQRETIIDTLKPWEKP